MNWDFPLSVQLLTEHLQLANRNSYDVMTITDKFFYRNKLSDSEWVNWKRRWVLVVQENEIYIGNLLEER